MCSMLYTWCSSHHCAVHSSHGASMPDFSGQLTWMLPRFGSHPRGSFWFCSKFGHSWKFADHSTWVGNFLKVTLVSLVFVCPKILGFYSSEKLQLSVRWWAGAQEALARGSEEEEELFVDYRTWRSGGKSCIPGHTGVPAGGFLSLTVEWTEKLSLISLANGHSIKVSQNLINWVPSTIIWSHQGRAESLS